MDAARVPTQEDMAAGGAAIGPVTVRTNLMARLGVAARVARVGHPKEPDIAPSTELCTARLWLRPMRAEDRAEFLRMYRLSRASLGELCPLGSGDTTTDEQVFERQLTLSDGAQRTGKARRLIALDPDGRIVGGFNINDITRGLEHTGEMVFWLSADARRLGYAQEAVHALLDHALADLPRGLGLHRVHGYIAPDNEPCRKLVRKVGMRPSMNSAPAELRIGARVVLHDSYEIFAAVDTLAERATMGHVVEGKPSMAEDLFGRGLLSILRTEHAAPPVDSVDDAPPVSGAV